MELAASWPCRAGCSALLARHESVWDQPGQAESFPASQVFPEADSSLVLGDLEGKGVKGSRAPGALCLGRSCWQGAGHANISLDPISR